MAPNTLGNGIWVKRAALEDLYWLMEMHIKGNGLETKLMASELICIQTVLDMKGNGLKINKKDSDARNGQMEVSIKACITTVRSMGKENSSGKMVHIIMETGTSTRCTVMAFLCGQTADPTKGNIKMIENTAKECT